MKEYLIKLNDELDSELELRARQKGVSKEQYLEHVAKLFLTYPHSIDREGMKKGYEEMGAINLSLADIGDCNGKTEHKKRLNIFRRPKPSSRK